MNPLWSLYQHNSLLQSLLMPMSFLWNLFQSFQFSPETSPDLESTPESAPIREPSEFTPEFAPTWEPSESTHESAPVRVLRVNSRDCSNLGALRLHFRALLYLAAVASGMLSWGIFISSNIIDLIAQILFKLN